MVKVLFLDVDGVLNRYQTKEKFGPFVGIDEELVENLKTIIEQTECKIVLSSTWRTEADSLQHVYDRIGEHHFIGVTPALGRLTYNIRPTEVEYWVQDNEDLIDTYCILDDDFEFHPHQKHFRTSFVKGGLTPEIAQAVIDYLNGRCDE